MSEDTASAAAGRPHPLEMFQSVWDLRPAVASKVGSVVALILAGGQGSRMRSHPDLAIARTPKPLVPLDYRRTMLGHTLRELEAAGLSQVIVLTCAAPGAGGEAISEHVLRYGGNLCPGVLREDEPLGTAGAVYAALRHLPEVTCVVVPVDTLFPHERLLTMLSVHKASGAAVTWAVTTRPGAGAQNTNRLRIRHGRLVHVAEHHDRPISASAPGVPATSAGVIIASAASYRWAFTGFAFHRERPRPVDLYRDLVPWLLGQGAPIGAYDIRCPAPDLGTPERLRRFAPPPGDQP